MPDDFLQKAFTFSVPTGPTRQQVVRGADGAGAGRDWLSMSSPFPFHDPGQIRTGRSGKVRDMGAIVYNFDVVTNLAAFVSMPIEHTDPVQWTVSENYIVDRQGIYIIHNTASQNFYVGIGSDMNERFGNRHEAAVHLGLTGADMQKIIVYTGTVSALNNAKSDVAPTFSRNNYSVVLDGLSVNLEKALIHAFLDCGVPGFKFNTNTKLVATRFFNNSDYDIGIQVNSLKCPEDFTSNGAYYGPLLYSSDSTGFNQVYWQAISKSKSVGFNRVE